MKSKLKKVVNGNVKLAFLFTGLQSFGRGIWMGNILSLYIVLFSEKAEGVFGLTSNELLGVTSGITGISMTLLVFPSGHWADKFGREKMLHLASLVGISAMLTLGFSQSIIPIFAAMFLWGAFQGLSRPAFESIFADSLASGKRSGTYAKLHLVMQTAMAVGPLLNVLLFLYFEDKWDINILRAVMYVGISFSLMSAVLLLFFRDARSLGDESESITVKPESDDVDTKLTERRKKIPLLLVSSNLIIGMGAGMSVRFFPVFFRSIYDLKPIAVQLVMAGTFIGTGALGIIAQKFSVKKGRGEIMLTAQVLATIFLFAIAFYPSLLLMIPLFILRGSLMNSTQPLSRSILMDAVPKKHRGKWNSVETIAWGLFWNASAVLGGFLIGENNYRLCFIVTGIIYTIGTIPVIFLIPLINREE
ncbi:MAG: MFS transporter [Candidatus Delongbacteria bacterium]